MSNLNSSSLDSSLHQDWVPETRFGKWFISTEMWVTYVLREAIVELHELCAGRLTPGARILDAGCGIGLSFAPLIEITQAASIIGVDIDASTLAVAEKSRLQHACQIELLHGSALHLDLPDNSVDAVFCHQLIHHVKDQAALLRELYRVLRPGGLLLSSESCQPFIEIYWVQWFFRHPNMVQKKADDYLALIREAGFQVGPADVRKSSPWWSLRDFGLRKKWGLPSATPEVTELLTVGQKPGQACN